MSVMNMDKRELTRLINEWNSSRYELFALSQPNERLEFHGVMRFYFQDAGEKVSTKCIRVDSTATTADVIEVLIEKFRPDMKSLSSPKDYAIYEVHVDSQERKMDPSERPLWIQLEWGKDGREGRFLLKNENCKTVQFDSNGETLIRDKKRMSKRDKKKLQKQKEAQKENAKVNVAEHLYKEVPDSNFTRSISNPEIVMARRRQQKLENKLKQIKNKDGGGTLKVYGETLKPDIPYKTLLMSNQDTAAFAVKETLEKYGLSSEDPDNYCLVQVVTPSREEREKHGAQIKEYILEDTACPLAILMKHPSTGGSIIFQIRRCTPDILAIRKQKKKQEADKQISQQPNSQSNFQQSTYQQSPFQPNSYPHSQQQVANKFNTIHSQSSLQQNKPSIVAAPLETKAEMSNKLPFLVELSYEGFELPQPRVIQIKSDFYEMGNDKYLASSHPLNYIRIDPAIPGIDKKHCALKKSSDNTQLLLVPYAETYVNDRLVKEHTQLFNQFTIRLGKYCLFRVENPNEMNNLVVAKVATGSAQLPANYGLLYEGQIADGVSPAPNRTEPGRQSQARLNAESAGLPGLLQFPDDNGEDALLAQICTSQNANWQFKLAPVYTMYMMLRYRLSRKYKPDLSFNEKLHSISYLVHKMVNYMREAVDLNHSDKYLLPYWLANASELLYFLKQDIHLSQISLDAQEALAECVQITFKYIVNIMQSQLDQVLACFFDPSDHVDELGAALMGSEGESFESEHLKRPMLRHCIGVLNEAMNLLRGSRVNAALTIQLFSQLFHYISIWLFNRLVGDQRSGLCSVFWGERLSRRLAKIQMWAEKQGLELAADCHLQKVTQAAFFLQSAKHDIQFLSSISSNCFALNSIQIKCLIKNYVMAPNEAQPSALLFNNLIAIAQNTADEVAKQEGKAVQMEEDVDLQLPFLLPEDGHSTEFIKGLPAGLIDFLESLQNMGHCWLWQNNHGPGNWKKFMTKDQTDSCATSQAKSNSGCSQAEAKSAHPQVVQIKLAKKNGGLGLSIVAARGTNQVTGIYIKSVVSGGAAADDGRLKNGDQLLAVDDNSLVNVTQERAAELMTKSGPVVLLTIAKDAAAYHNLEALLNESAKPQQQFNPTQSMPVLNNNQNFNLNQMQTNYSASTLPRNHHLHQSQQQQTQQPTVQQEQVGYRARSMSSEILDRQPVPRMVPQPSRQPAQQVTSPSYQRSLPNEQQIRYGSERPVFMDNKYQRNLPNELAPRFGSERPASNLPQPQPPHRYHTDNSPSKQMAPSMRQRQASLNELDEINYNNQNENKFDDLYGKVNNQQRTNEQYRTLPIRQNNLTHVQNIDDSRTKSFGQLYEHIWSQNNTINGPRQTNCPMGQQTNQHAVNQQFIMQQQQQQNNNLHISQPNSQHANQHQNQHNNMLANHQQQLVNRMNQISVSEAKVSRTNILFNNQTPSAAQRNYENQILNGQNRPPPPAVMAKPTLPVKNFNLNMQKYSEQHTEIHVQPSTAKIVNQKETHLVSREKSDEEFRLNLLKQRIEMLNDLESKAYRTNEEENKLNILRTEIEFDKRVIEMKNLNNVLDQTTDDNDTLDYAPEVRERFANELIQRRNQNQDDTELKMDRLIEARREEQRLKRYVDRTSNSNINSQEYVQNFQEVEVFHVPTRSSTDLSELSVSKPQKHVQFMQETEMISPKSNGLKATSSSSSSDQLDSSPSTPPPLPAQPQPNHHPKRVMFSDIEFERDDAKNEDLPNTPSVIGANEVYVDQRLKAKLQQQQMQQNMIIEGEKLSFKDKMKLFAKQSGENILNDAENKLKVSRKQREIESKFVIADNK